MALSSTGHPFFGVPLPASLDNADADADADHELFDDGAGQRKSARNDASPHSRFRHRRNLSSLDGDDPDVASPADSVASAPLTANSHGLQTHSDAEGRAASVTANKRRKTAPGSRGVANLTPEQLAKKRANDREAQRAIRERQKARSEAYERRISELESQRPYQELQEVLRLKEAVEAENADIKRMLASIVSMIQPALGNQTPPVSRPPPGPPSLNNASTPTSVASPASMGNPQAQQWHGGSGSGSGSGSGGDPSPTGFPQVKMFNQQRYDLVHGLDLGAERLGLDFLLDPTKRIARIQSGSNGAQDSPQYRHVPMKHDWTGAAVVQGNQLQYVAGNPAPSGRLEYNSGGGAAAPGTEDAGYSTPIKNCPPTCPLDSLLLDFLHERRQRAAEGLSAQEIVGPRYPSVSSLLNPSHSRFAHPLSKVFTDILTTFPDLSSLPERVAVLYIMFLIMRWEIQPTRENYLRLPDFARPRAAQLCHQHPAWTDHIPFPGMRDALLTSGDYGPGLEGFPFEDFFIPFTTTLSLNWPYEDTDALLQWPEGDELMINPVFERHLRRGENWTLGSAFDKAFPALAGTYNLKDDSGVITKAVQL